MHRRYRPPRSTIALWCLAIAWAHALGCSIDGDPSNDLRQEDPDTSELQDAELDRSEQGHDATPDTAGGDASPPEGPPPSDTEDDPDDDIDPVPGWPPPRVGCNGHPALCDRSYAEVVFPGTHNSMSNAEDRWIVPNQNRNLRSQLVDGIRVFLLDIYLDGGEVALCHSICLAGRRPFLEAMNELRAFLESQPREVITLILEDYVDAEAIEDVIVAAGLTPYLYARTEGMPWPTLGAMIAQGRRLVITAQDEGPPPTWLHNIWSLAWDTPYTFRSVEEFSCRRNRGSTSNDLFLLNHWILNPAAAPRHGEEANAYDVLMARIDTCIAQWSRLPTFIAVDFYDIGDLFEVVDVLNGIAEPRER